MSHLKWRNVEEKVWSLSVSLHWTEFSAEGSIDRISKNLHNKFPDAKITYKDRPPEYDEIRNYIHKILTIKFIDEADEAYFIMLMSKFIF